MSEPRTPPPGVDPRLGTVVAGKYTIDALLGAGGMGRVYRATHRELGEPVAVKFLLPLFASMPEIRARFRREAVALARLRHPGIVSIIDFGEHGDDLYMVMELLKGVRLSEILSAGPLPPFRLGALFDQILQVVEATHALGIVHRDLKPDNIMVLDAGDRLWRIKILDFGLVLLADPAEQGRLTETGAVRGTPHYMSPEQCRGRHTDASTDVYSVGVMLFEALTGRLPFTSDDTATLMAQHLFLEPPSLREVAPDRDIPEGFEAIVREALGKKPEDRPTASELRDRIAAVLAGTDAKSLAARAADERVRAMALDRGDRAITGRVAKVSSPPPGDATGRVVIWMPHGDLSRELRAALAVAGVDTVTWSDPAAPPGDAAVVVVALEHDGRGRCRRVRETRALESAPVLVVGVEPADLPGLIHDGASDALPRGATVDQAARKVQRLLRRGR